jgi:hypothetical protein
MNGYRIGRGVLGLLVIAVAAASLPSAATAACTTATKTAAYDDPADGDTAYFLGSDRSRFQSFVVAETVTLDRVSIFIESDAGTDITVAIRSGSTTGSVLGSSTRAVDNPVYAFTDFAFASAAIELRPGTTYFIDVRRNPAGYAHWRADATGEYAGGNAFLEVPPSGLNTMEAEDHLFRVWGATCTADPVDEETTPTTTTTTTTDTTTTTTDTATTGQTPDVTKPVITALSMSSSVFQAAGSGPAFAAKVGTRLSFSASEASAVRFTVRRRTKGRRVAGRCRVETKVNRTRTACVRWVGVTGAFTVSATAGANAFAFRGRIGGRTLKPGRYRLNGRATDAAGNRSAVTRTQFRIVR